MFSEVENVHASSAQPATIVARAFALEHLAALLDVLELHKQIIFPYISIVIFTKFPSAKLTFDIPAHRNFYRLSPSKRTRISL